MMNLLTKLNISSKLYQQESSFSLKKLFWSILASFLT